mgnify:CR=1 FL=1
MKDYGITRSTDRPLDVEVLQTKVFVASNIQQVTVTIEEETVTEYEFNLMEYDKDEYILHMIEQNADLEQNLTDTQLALVEVYEMLG